MNPGSRVAALCAWAIERNIEAAYATLVLHHLPAEHASAPANAAPPHTSMLVQLTRREQDVLELAAHGLPNDAIAEQLCLSVCTVRNHLQRCFDKLGAHSRAEAFYLLHQRRDIGIYMPGITILNS